MDAQSPACYHQIMKKNIDVMALDDDRRAAQQTHRMLKEA